MAKLASNLCDLVRLKRPRRLQWSHIRHMTGVYWLREGDCEKEQFIG